MVMDVYMIVMTAFALFGIYCFVETVAEMISASKFPPSVTVMKNNFSEKTFQKIKYVQENLPNNYTVFYPFNETDSEEKQIRLLQEYLKDVLGVNKQQQD